jgi:hypothetical protein
MNRERLGELLLLGGIALVALLGLFYLLMHW